MVVYGDSESEGVQHLVKEVIGLEASEELVLIYDGRYANIAELISTHCKIKGLRYRSVFFEYNAGKNLPDNISSLFLDTKHDVILIGLKENIWHTDARKRAKYEKGKRLVNLLHPDEPCASYFADISEIREKGTQLKRILDDSCQINITSPSGTEITARIGRTFCEADDYTRPKSGGDFPIGEVGFGPVDGSVNGQIVYDYKIQHVGFVSDSPQVMEVIDDKVHLTGCSTDFQSLINSHPVFQYISEISLGINHIWTEVHNKHSIVEEKNLGTLHFGHGGNLSYGNRQGPHFDAVILQPTVYLDDWLVMENGILNEKYIS